LLLLLLLLFSNVGVAEGDAVDDFVVVAIAGFVGDALVNFHVSAD
jgi:hypothetical protein